MTGRQPSERGAPTPVRPEGRGQDRLEAAQRERGSDGGWDAEARGRTAVRSGHS